MVGNFKYGQFLKTMDTQKKINEENNFLLLKNVSKFWANNLKLLMGAQNYNHPWIRWFKINTWIEYLILFWINKIWADMKYLATLVLYNYNISIIRASLSNLNEIKFTVDWLGKVF